MNLKNFVIAAAGLAFLRCSQPSQPKDNLSDQYSVYLTGLVLDKDGKPMANAVARVKGKNLTDTTGADGRYLVSERKNGQSSLPDPFNDSLEYLKDGQVITMQKIPKWIDTLPDVFIVQRDIFGHFSSAPASLSRIIATISGDGIPASNPIVAVRGYIPATQNYGGYVYFVYSTQMLNYSVYISVYNSDSVLIGRSVQVDFPSNIGDVEIPDFDPNNMVVVPGKPLELVQPVGGETWHAGDTVTIQWKINDSTKVSSVIIKLSTNNGMTYDFMITSAGSVFPPQTSFPWVIDSSQVSDQCIIRVSDYNDPSIRDESGVFSVLASTPLSLPTITTQPVSQTVTEGGSVTFSVVATGNPPIISYQWWKNTGGFIAPVAGGTSATLTINSVMPADTGNYFVVVVNVVGGVTSTPAHLTVNGSSTPPVMRYLSGGTFQRGQPNPNIPCYTCSNKEQPVHSVTLSSFYMDTTEVIQGDYFALMGVNPSYFPSDLWPVETVTWFDAVLYCNKRSKCDGLDTVYSYASVMGAPGNGCVALSGLAVDFAKNGYRLPTDAEWEYACRAGSTMDYYWGRSFPPTTLDDTLTIDSNAVWRHNAGGMTQAVAGKKPNAFGLYDMAGNVMEWCNDWHGVYDSTAQTDPTGPSSGSYRVTRGGCYDDNSGSQERSTYRGNYLPTSREKFYGFRCVRR